MRGRPLLWSAAAHFVLDTSDGTFFQEKVRDKSRIHCYVLTDGVLFHGRSVDTAAVRSRLAQLAEGEGKAGISNQTSDSKPM
jgi:hypothetical protein